ncbi:MAG: DUF2092 domain-containing protein [Chthoniobacterales bacterium]
MKKPLLLSLATLLLTGAIHAEKVPPVDPNALAILKHMSDTLAGAKAFTVRSNALLEVPSATGQFLTLRSLGKIALRRPDKMSAMLGGDAPAFEFFYDGGSVSAVAPKAKVYSTTNAPATIDEMLAGVRRQTGINLHFSPLLLSDPSAHLTRNLQSAVVVGQTRVNGVLCDHLAFRAQGVNWEIWVSTGRTALPYRFAATFTDRANFPRKFIEFSRWNLHPWLFGDSFTFHPPSGFKEIPFSTVLRDAGR